MADTASKLADLQPLTVTCGDAVLAVLAPHENVYRIIRGAIVYRDDLNKAREGGKVRLSYDSDGRLLLDYSVQTNLHG